MRYIHYLFISSFLLFAEHSFSTAKTEVSSKMDSTLDFGFESWYLYDIDSVYVPRYWSLGNIGILCSPTPISGERDSLTRYAGKYAAKLKSRKCIDDGEQTYFFSGYIALGKGKYRRPVGTGTPYTSRPDSISFQYQFDPVMGDTAHVEALLCRVDSAGYLTDTIAEVNAPITEAKGSFSKMSLGLNYQSTKTPNLLHIEFYTSRNMALRNTDRDQGTDAHAHPGTTLWVDDVQLYGGDVVVIPEKKQAVLNVYPNPADNSVQLELSEASGIVQLYNLQGVLVATLPVATKNIELQLTALSSGLYLIRHQSKQGVATSRLSVIHP